MSTIGQMLVMSMFMQDKYAPTGRGVATQPVGRAARTEGQQQAAIAAAEAKRARKRAKRGGQP